jgi:hypothetical protein
MHFFSYSSFGLRFGKMKAEKEVMLKLLLIERGLFQGY